MTAALIAVGLLLGMAAVVVPVMVAAYKRQRIEWRRAVGQSWRWAAVPGVDVDEGRLIGAVESAWVALALHRCFPSSTLLQAKEVLHVMVQRVPSWHSPQHGGNVAGVTSGHVVYVGSDFAAVCHELAHLCEFLEMGAYDFEHGTWGVRRIQVAVDEWQQATRRSS